MTQRFPIRFTGFNRAMVVLGILPSRSVVEVHGHELRVRMTWAFRMRAPLASVRAVVPYAGRVWGWGAHGWRGRWLVNGSSSGILQIDLEPPARARTIGWPIKVRTLLVSVEEPEGLMAALARR